MSRSLITFVTSLLKRAVFKGLLTDVNHFCVETYFNLYAAKYICSFSVDIFLFINVFKLPFIRLSAKLD